MKVSLVPHIVFFSSLPTVWGSVTTDTVIEACLTKFAPESVRSVPSTTTTVTIEQAASVISTSIPSTTVQASPTTVTAKSTTLVTVTKTLANSNVDTFTSTTTVVSTVDITATITATVNTIATWGVAVTVTPTTTIATSPGFIYASDSPDLKKRAFDVAQDDDPIGARHLIPRPNKLPAVRRHETTSTTTSSEKCYPTAVTCGVLVDIISTATKVITGPTSTITNPASTATKTSTVTSTITSSWLPADASTTLVITSSLLVTSSFTASTTLTSTTSTLTVTVTAAEATYYAACGPENLLTMDNEYPGGYVDYAGPSYPDPYITLNSDSAYDCCVACQQNSDCGGATYTGTTCYLDQPGGSCDPQYGGITYTAFGSSFEGYTLIDGNCGIITGT